MSQFPCKTCCESGMSCCSNPQITWNIQEVDELINTNPEWLKKVVMYKAEMPGFVYLLDKELILEYQQKSSTDDGLYIDNCIFYDTKNNCCSVYDYRPEVCKNYGDPQYMACPYDGYTDEGLIELVKNHRDFASNLHQTSKNDSKKFMEDL